MALIITRFILTLFWYNGKHKTLKLQKARPPPPPPLPPTPTPYPHKRCDADGYVHFDTYLHTISKYFENFRFMRQSFMS